MKDKGRSGKIIGMNRCYFAALALLIAGCAPQQAPAVAVVSTATPVPTAPPITVPIPAMPVQITPTPDPADAARQAVVLRELARLRTASPDRDFAIAWANGDTRFLGVQGYSLSLPGLPKEMYRTAIMHGQFRPLEGTTETPNSEEEMELNNVAWKYATRYNQLLLQKLDEQKNAKVE